MVLALGLGLTATYAFKAHKTGQTIGVLDGSGSIVSGVFYFDAVAPANIGNSGDYSCNSALAGKYCELNYSGTYTFTEGEQIAIPLTEFTYPSDEDDLKLEEN